jgi:hypothetical protein
VCGDQLFDEFERSDSRQALFSEDTFSFLNRVRGPYWERIRSELNAWYDAFPDETRDLWRRFRSRDHRQHYGAWWELYLHRLVTALGFEATPNAQLPGGRSRPDVLAVRGEQSFYVEAVTVFSGIVASTPRSALEPAILDVINTIDASNFFVSVGFARAASSMPRRAQIIRPIEDWLSTHDPDRVLEMTASELPTTQISIGDWLLDLRLMPRSPKFRGRPDNQLIGTHGVTAGYTNDRDQIYRALERKKKQHKAPDGPMIIAVLATNGFVGNDEVIGALFGSEAVRVNVATGETTLTRNPDGFWVGTRGPASKKVSAVLTGVNVVPATCARSAPRLWHHFAPDRPFEADLPLASARVVGDELVFTDARPPHEILGLSADWPGPESPFETSG